MGICESTNSKPFCACCKNFNRSRKYDYYKLDNTVESPLLAGEVTHNNISQNKEFPSRPELTKYEPSDKETNNIRENGQNNSVKMTNNQNDSSSEKELIVEGEIRINEFSDFKESKNNNNWEESSLKGESDINGKEFDNDFDIVKLTKEKKDMTNLYDFSENGQGKIIINSKEIKIENHFLNNNDNNGINYNNFNKRNEGNNVKKLLQNNNNNNNNKLKNEIFERCYSLDDFNENDKINRKDKYNNFDVKENLFNGSSNQNGNFKDNHKPHSFKLFYNKVSNEFNTNSNQKEFRKRILNKNNYNTKKYSSYTYKNKSNFLKNNKLKIIEMEDDNLIFDNSILVVPQHDDRPPEIDLGFFIENNPKQQKIE